MPSDAGSTCARDPNAGVTTFEDLPPDVKNEILGPTNLPEPRDLANLRAVSHWMRDAVDATGREIRKFSNQDAAKLGNVSLLKDRHSRGLLKGDERSLVCAAAARTGQLEELKALRADFPWDSRTCAFAAEHGQLEVLMWARANGCPWDEYTCERAAHGGHLEVLKWARAYGCPWNSFTCSYAADGHLKVLQWARANGCPWKSFTCSAAAMNGQLETLKWARENGCPWDEETCRAASRGGHLETLQWLRANFFWLPAGRRRVRARNRAYFLV